MCRFVYKLLNEKVNNNQLVEDVAVHFVGTDRNTRLTCRSNEGKSAWRMGAALPLFRYV